MKERVRKFDAKRKKLKEDLEAREEAYKNSCDSMPDTRSDEFMSNTKVQWLNFDIILFRLLV